jgi:hypothetical protein
MLGAADMPIGCALNFSTRHGCRKKGRAKMPGLFILQF